MICALCSAKTKLARLTVFGPKTITLALSFLRNPRSLDETLEGRLPLRGIGQIQTAILAIMQGVLADERSKTAVRLHRVNLPAKELNAVEAQLRQINEICSTDIRTDRWRSGGRSNEGRSRRRSGNVAPAAT